MVIFKKTMMKNFNRTKNYKVKNNIRFNNKNIRANSIRITYWNKEKNWFIIMMNF